MPRPFPSSARVSPVSSNFQVESLERRVLLASVPTGFSEQQIATGLSSPTAMQFAPDGRLFVAEQTGGVRVITAGGQLQSTPFVTLNVSSAGERGVLGIAFDPNFASNQFVYVYYTATTPTLHNRISRFVANGNVAQTNNGLPVETVLLDLDNLTATNHNGGALNFGPDGKLYAAVGENAVPSNAQTLSNLHGKMLRINPDGSIPSDNPFFNQTTGKNRAIWALGLRNPFTFAFQPGTGRMFINDVGDGGDPTTVWEEINEGGAGRNYGWPNTGDGPFNQGQFPGFTNPFHAYDHQGNACAITGGAFYNPASANFPPGYVGDYFFADFCAGWIKHIDPASKAIATFASDATFLVDLKVRDDGSLYYLERGNGGRVVRVHFTAQSPSITQQPQNQTVTEGAAATFSVVATGTAPLTYQWRRNGADIPGANSASYTLFNAQPSDNGATFSARITNQFGNAFSNAATLAVTANKAPIAGITTPAIGTLYTAGQTINFSGTGADPEDGNLSAGAFTWRVDLHHDQHDHPHVQPFSGATGGSFVIPTTGEVSANVFYRITLTVRDSKGLTHTTFRDVVPRKATVTLASNVAGAQLTLDGQPFAAGGSFVGVAGIQRQIGAPGPQTINNISYVFDSWSDGGAQSHTISTPASNTTYTASFRAAGGVVGNGTGLSATYFNNSNFTGTQLTRTDATVNFNFAAGSPGPSIANETFSAVWTGQVQAQFSQTYTFHTLSDDGVRLFVNGQKLIENWTNHPATENSGSITLVAGQKYDIRIEYYENVGNAVMQLRWSGPSTPKQVVPTSQLYPSASPQPPPPGQGLSATYFDNANFTGNSVTHIDPGVNFDFGLGSPAPGIGNETFSVRWQGQVVPQFSQTYTFHVRADDGVRLWVNGQLLVDDFTVHAARETSGSIALVAGQKYDIRLDFFDNFHHAVAELRWSSASTPKQIIPASALVPTSGPTTDALTSTDIGGVSPAGGTTVITPGSAYDITGGAFDVWHNADQFRFLHRQLTGDFDAKVRVESLTNLDEWTKAGLMARESLAANSRNVFALTTPTRYRLTWRSQPAGGSSGAGDGPVAYPNTWLRLRRTGNTFEAFRSTNGVNWTSFGSTTVTMSNTIFVGLAVASHSTGALATARFRDVIV